jgi:flavin-dependent dehydrogenase
MPDHGYVARRLELDEMLLRAAETAGAEVEEGVEAIGPLTTGNRISGVVANRNGSPQEYRADVVIAADGAHSKLKRMITADERPSWKQKWLDSDHSRGLVAVAIRAEMSSQRPLDGTLEAHILQHNNSYLPGYGWVFPVGGDRVNIGVGYLTSFEGWRDINARTLFQQFMNQLPDDWALPDIGDLVRTKALQAWRLPMGFTTLPAWRPGIIFAGDAAGVAKPASGAGISRALESGMIAADVSLEAIGSGIPEQLADYDRLIKQRWGKTYRVTRSALRLESHPKGIALTLGLVDNSFMRRAILRSIYGRSSHMDYRDTTARSMRGQVISKAV